MIEESTKSWMVAVNKAMMQLHDRFKTDPKIILTESDLKCWLFLKLKKVENATFSVHTEITHYPYSKTVQDGITVKVQKYFFRDLTILDDKNVSDNSKLWNNSNDDSILSKGFRHRGPAIHFELKLVRQAVNKNIQPLIDANDIQKLKNYSPKNSSHQRHFVIVWGSRSENVGVTELEGKLRSSLEGFNNIGLNGLLNFYLFDKKSLKHFSWQQNELVEI